MVLGYPLPPTWSLSDGRQARQGLDTDVTPFHKSFNVLQRVHFRLAIGWDTSETATLVVGTAECLVQVNKEISLVFCFLSTQLGYRPRGQR